MSNLTHEENLIDSILQHPYNRDKVQAFISLGLHPMYGLSANVTYLMYDLYQMSSGDNSYAGRYGCGACQQFIFDKMQDFLNYNDNVGKPLLNWEAPIETPKKKKKDTE